MHPTQHLWLITSKEDAIFQKRNPLRQILPGTPTVPVWQPRQSFKRESKDQIEKKINHPLHHHSKYMKQNTEVATQQRLHQKERKGFFLEML